MKITGNSGIDLPAVAPAAAAQPVEAVQPAAPAGAATAGALQSAVLQPALESLRDMPEIDQAKVDAIRDALARGEVTFDAGKLAGLIERFHGSHG